MKKVLFNLKRFWEGRDLWDEIKSGKKRIEYRDNSKHWNDRLIQTKPKRAWFVIGYPKGNLPRLEADIIDIHIKLNQIHIHFINVIEIKTNIIPDIIEIKEPKPDTLPLFFFPPKC